MRLTEREKEVLAEYLWHGYQGGAAMCLGISEGTIDSHIAAILARTASERSIKAVLVSGWAAIPQGVPFKHTKELEVHQRGIGVMPGKLPGDPLAGLSLRELEALIMRAKKMLTQCMIDSQEGAVTVHARAKLGPKQSESRFILQLCPSCIERYRLPVTRAEGPEGDPNDPLDDEGVIDEDPEGESR